MEGTRNRKKTEQIMDQRGAGINGMDLLVQQSSRKQTFMVENNRRCLSRGEDQQLTADSLSL